MVKDFFTGRWYYRYDDVCVLKIFLNAIRANIPIIMKYLNTVLNKLSKTFVRQSLLHHSPLRRRRYKYFPLAQTNSQIVSPERKFNNNICQIAKFAYTIALAKIISSTTIANS